MQRPFIFLPCLFCVGIYKIDNAFHQRVGKAIFHCSFSPGVIDFSLLTRTFHCFGQLKQTLRSVRSPIQENIFHPFQQFLWYFVIYFQHGGVHNAHVHAVVNGMIKKSRVHGFPNQLVSAKAERNIAYATAHVCARKISAYPFRGLEEINGIISVFVNTGCYRKNIRIKDDILRCKLYCIDQNSIRSLANGYSSVIRICLPSFIKCHDNRSRSISLHQLGLLNKFFLACFQADGVDNPFSLQTFQARFNHFPLGRINHHRDARYLRLRGHQVQELDHGRFRIEHAFVHVHINHLGATTHLIEGNLQGIIKLIIFN